MRIKGEAPQELGVRALDVDRRAQGDGVFSERECGRAIESGRPRIDERPSGIQRWCGKPSFGPQRR
jgi:hypothetical protein